MKKVAFSIDPCQESVGTLPNIVNLSVSAYKPQWMNMPNRDSTNHLVRSADGIALEGIEATPLCSLMRLFINFGIS